MTHYDTLEIKQDATEKEIKTAYRRLVKKYHPDINKQSSAVEKFKQIQKAYDVLSDAQQKQQYDFSLRPMFPMQQQVWYVNGVPIVPNGQTITVTWNGEVWNKGVWDDLANY